MSAGAGLGGVRLASAALPGRSYSGRPDLLVYASQVFNGLIVGYAAYALGRHVRRRRSAPPSLNTAEGNLNR
jgi:hypothetical protein